MAYTLHPSKDIPGIIPSIPPYIIDIQRRREQPDTGIPAQIPLPEYGEDAPTEEIPRIPGNGYEIIIPEDPTEETTVEFPTIFSPRNGSLDSLL